MHTVNDYRTPLRQILAQVMEQDEIFSGFSQPAKQELMRHVRFVRHLSEQHILQQRQSLSDVYVLLSGSLQVGWLQSNGELIVNDYIRINSVFNMVALLQNKALNYDYFTVGQVELAIISGEVFVKLLKNEPVAMWHLMQLLSQRMYAMFEQNKYLRTANLTQHIAYHLLKLYEKYGTQQEQQSLIKFRMSQQEFAELFNVSRQTLNKHLQFFVQQHILEWSYGQIRILDLAKLRKMSELQ